MQVRNIAHPASPSVFISSTVGEFRDLRSALAYVLRAQGLIVHLSEAVDFAISGDRSAVDECFRNIRACDYYVLLIGNTRGSILPEGVSVTRQEYRVAREQFLSSGQRQPRMLLYLRQDTAAALQGGRRFWKKAGIDDPNYLKSFVEEVKHPPVEGAPSFLTTFRDSEELIRSVTSRLNLGRTFSETLLRYSLLSELTSNLARMMGRMYASAFPHHWYMTRVREGISIKPQESGRQILLSDDCVISLLSGLLRMIRGTDLRTKVMEESLDQGLFLDFNPARGVLEESPLCRALRQTIEDVQVLRQLDDASIRPEWDVKLRDDVRVRWRGRPHSLEVAGHDLVLAFAYYDRVENVYNGHVALSKVLLGLTESLESCPRGPLTPYGKEEEQRLRAERVSAAEITHLIKNGVWPFGAKIVSKVLGATREEQIRKLTERMPTVIKKAGMDTQYPGILEKDVLRGAAEQILDTHTALPDEGIEDLR